MGCLVLLAMDIERLGSPKTAVHFFKLAEHWLRTMNYLSLFSCATSQMLKPKLKLFMIALIQTILLVLNMTSQDPMFLLEKLIVATIPIYGISETINLFVLCFEQGLGLD